MEEQILPKDILKFRQNGNRSEHWMNMSNKDESWLSKYREDDGIIYPGFNSTMVNDFSSPFATAASSFMRTNVMYGNSFRIA